MDICAAAFDAEVVVWLENDSGVSPVFTRHTIVSEANAAAGVRVADVDGDGDLDVLSA